MKTRTALLSLACGLIALATTATLAASTEGSPAAPMFSGAINDVVKLVQSKVPDSVVIAYIRNSSGPFQPSADEVLHLRDMGITSEVITALLERGGELRQQGQQAPPSPAYTYSQGTYSQGGAPTPITQPTGGYSDAEITTEATTPSVTYINYSYPSYGYAYPYYSSWYSYYPYYYYPFYSYAFWPFYAYSYWPYHSYCSSHLFASHHHDNWNHNHNGSWAHNGNWNHNGNGNWNGGSSGGSRMTINRGVNINRVPTTRTTSASSLIDRPATTATGATRSGTATTRQFTVNRNGSSQFSTRSFSTPTTVNNGTAPNRTQFSGINRSGSAQFSRPTGTAPVNRQFSAPVNRSVNASFSRTMTGPGVGQISRPMSAPSGSQFSRTMSVPRGNAQFSRPMSMPSGGGAQFSRGSTAPSHFSTASAPIGRMGGGSSMGGFSRGGGSMGGFSHGGSGGGRR